MKDSQDRFSFLWTILFWGTMWGIFEAVFGYLLHLISFHYGWLIWVPVACFFLSNVYRKTGRISSIILVGLLSSCIKLTNLCLPGRLDKVLNPAVSILMEAMAMAFTVYVIHCLSEKSKNGILVKGFAALGMNTGWRLLFILYLLIWVPDWMREISVISSADKFITFFVTQNLFTSMLLFLGYHWKRFLLHPIEKVEQTLSTSLPIPHTWLTLCKTSIVIVMLFLNVALELIL